MLMVMEKVTFQETLVGQLAHCLAHVCCWQSQNMKATKEEKKRVKRGREGQVKQGWEGQLKEELESVMTSFVKEMQKADASIVVELEEKRMKYEEMCLQEERDYKEEEEKGKTAFEDRRRKEEHAFQL